MAVPSTVKTVGVFALVAFSIGAPSVGALIIHSATKGGGETVGAVTQEAPNLPGYIQQGQDAVKALNGGAPTAPPAVAAG